MLVTPDTRDIPTIHLLKTRFLLLCIPTIMIVHLSTWCDNRERGIELTSVEMAIDIVTGLFRHTQACSKTRGAPNTCRGSIFGTSRLITNGKAFHELLFIIVIIGIIIGIGGIVVSGWSLIIGRWSLIISIYIIVVIRIIIIRGGSIIVHHGSSIIIDGGIIVKRAIIILWPVIIIIRRWRRRRIIIRRRRHSIICISIIMIALKVGIQRLRRIGRNTKALIRGGISSNTPHTIVLHCLTSTFAVTAMKQAIQ
mmetsp:Transcript_4944/g.9158  ORF Transcript_4944/g.9158 Transcript_4944/m.9158 type:complete len:253 (+) Transcript_4944:243-1001(+)